MTHVLVRSADGTTHLFPSWMASPEASAIEIVTTPRLPTSRLCELRRFLDQTVLGLPSEDHVPAGGNKHGEVRVRQTDLFESRPVAELPEAQRQKAVVLLGSLLTEVLAMKNECEGPEKPRERDHDKDYR